MNKREFKNGVKRLLWGMLFLFGAYYNFLYVCYKLTFLNIFGWVICTFLVVFFFGYKKR